MKKIWLFFIISWILSIFQVQANQVKLDTVFEIQKFIEQNIERDKLNIQSKIYFNSHKNILEKHCPSSAIEESKQQLEGILKIRQPPQSSPQAQKQLIERFDILKQAIPNISSNDPYNFCKMKYLLYSLRETTQDTYKTHIQKSQEEAKTAPEQEHHSAPEQKKHFTILYTHPISQEEKQKKRIDHYIQNLLGTMYHRKILSAQDLKTLNRKIEINVINACSTTKWSFHLTHNTLSKEKAFKGIKLNVSICQEYQLYKHLEQILSHEIGHYIYFFKDKKTEKFNRLCRSQQHSSCKNEEFVSSYAKISKEEDYAESFSYRYRYQEKEFWSAPANEILYLKEQHFNKLFT